jgi:hypothetical protein
MSLSLTGLLVPTASNMLGALDGWLRKAEAELGAEAADALMSARLASDMFPLATQVRFACVQALEPLYRLRGEAFPDSLSDLLAEGRAGGEQPGTIAGARARIAETVAALEAVPAGGLDRAPDDPVAHSLPSGMVFDLTAEGYARDWVMAQFYFHLMTAYAILRHEGVALGKIDYIPHLLPHLRPAGAPPA